MGVRKPRKTRRAAAKSKPAAASTQRLRAMPVGGRAGKGVSFEPGAQAVALGLAAGASAAPPEVDRPRPATTRYPIDLTDFESLKGTARKQKLKRAKSEMTLARDSGRPKPKTVSAAAAAAALAAPLAFGMTGMTGPTAAAPGSVGAFGGISATGWAPPDCTLAAGPAHVLAAVNSTVHVYAKTGGAPLLQRTLTAWFSNVISQAKIFDPKALYDQHAGRWVLLCVALGQSSNTSFFLLSVSKTSDPLGGWFNYKLDATKDGDTATNNWADYPGLGVDAQALYLTANMFQFNGAFQYAKVRVVPKAQPYAGGAVTFRDVVKLKNADGNLAFTVSPCHTYGAPQVQYFVNTLFPSMSAPTRTLLSLWSLTDPLGNPTMTRRNVGIAAYGLPPDATQKGTSTALDTGDVRVLNAVFRGGSVWTTFTSRHDWGDGTNVAVAHWLQVDATTGALVQQGLFGTGGRHYFYPALMPDGNGNATMVFARSGAAEFAGTRVTGRLAADTLGQLQASAELKAGVARYVHVIGGRNRWGDYAGIANDPTDNRTVWCYHCFASAVDTWGTWLGATRF